MINIMIRKKIKPYKSAPPIVTITKIRNILSELGIIVKESYTQNGEFHSCRISIINDELGSFDIGTNGKGKTIEFAFASAYAEFMERLQNNMLIKGIGSSLKRYLPKDINDTFLEKQKDNGGALDYIYDPKEKYASIEEVINTQFGLLKELLKETSVNKIENALINKLKINELICVPFYNKTLDKTEYLPIELIFQTCGSNGMCAGNDPQEAIIQGICEIFERYAGREIYNNKLTPPTIPHESFIEFPVYNSIKELELEGLSITIKDFSLGRGLPVIGVIVVNKASNKYNVKIGSDPWPVTALERCITELHQSSNGIRLIEKRGFGNYLEKEFKGIDRKVAKYINMRKIFTNATGQWPDSIFFEKPSYDFKGLDFSQAKSNDEDLNYLCALIENLEKNIYIRDVSYLRFNSYYVVIPGLSEGKLRFEDNFTFIDFYNKAHFLNKIERLDFKQMTELCDALENNKKLFEKHGLVFSNEFNYISSTDLQDLDIDIFICMLNIKLKRYDKALLAIDDFLTDKDTESYIYFYACRDYIYCMQQNKDRENIIINLSKLYNVQLVEEVIEDLGSSDKIFDNYNFPNCFNCDKCKAVKECKYFKITAIAKRIQNTQVKNTLSHSQLSQIFYKLN